MKFFTRQITETRLYQIIWFAIFITEAAVVFIESVTDPNINFTIKRLLAIWLDTLPLLALQLLYNFLVAPSLMKEKYFLFSIKALLLYSVFVAWTIVFQRFDGYSNVISVYAKCTVGLILLISNTGTKYAMRYRDRVRKMEEMEDEINTFKLDHLRKQINPHFIMNTLNSIHMLVDVDPDKAKASIIELSKLFRQILSENHSSLVPLSVEINFINTYLKLMKMRYSEDEMVIRFDCTGNIYNAEVPPLVLATIMENAFKHGVTGEGKDKDYIISYVDVKDGKIIFCCENAYPGDEVEEERKRLENRKDKSVGMVNIRKRLDIIYEKDYILDIKKDSSSFRCYLEIPERANKDLLTYD